MSTKQKIGITEIIERPDPWTVNGGKINAIFTIPKNERQLERYRQEAAEMLDKLSVTLHPQGIEILLFAMLEKVDEGYYGEGNA